MTTSEKPAQFLPPEVFGDFGQDDVFATESHPEGLRDENAAPVEPGSLPHPRRKPGKENGDAAGLPEPPEISIG